MIRKSFKYNKKESNKFQIKNANKNICLLYYLRKQFRKIKIN